MISKKFLFVTLLGMLGLTSCKSDQYYKVGNNFDARIFSRTESPVDIYNDEGFRWNKEGDIITLTDSTGVHVYTTKYSALIRFVSDEYIGLLSGLRTFDAGWRYLVYPTYSDLVILNKSDLSLVFRKRIYRLKF